MSVKTLDPQSTPRLADQVHRKLLDAILSGEISAGQQLHDREWSTRLKISRTPVREAFQYLQWQGLTDVQAARHTKLVAFSADAARKEADGWAAVHASLADALCTGDDDVSLSELRRAHSRHRDADSEGARITASFEFFRILRDASRHFALHLSGTAVSYRLRLAASQLPDARDADATLHTAVITAIDESDASAYREAFAQWARHLALGSGAVA